MLLAKQPGDTGVFASATTDAISLYRVDDHAGTDAGRQSLWRRAVPPLQRWRLSDHDVASPTALAVSADPNLHLFVADASGAGWIGHVGDDPLLRLFANAARLHHAQHRRATTHHDAVRAVDTVSSTSSDAETPTLGDVRRGVITAAGWDPRNGAVLGLGRQDAVVQLLDVEYLGSGVVVDAPTESTPHRTHSPSPSTGSASGPRRVRFATAASMQCGVIHERVLDGPVTAMDWVPLSHLTVVAARRRDGQGYSAEIVDLRAPDTHPRYLGVTPDTLAHPTYRYGGVGARHGCFADVLACESSQTYIASVGARDEVDVVQLWDLRSPARPVVERVYAAVGYAAVCWCAAEPASVVGVTRAGTLRVHHFNRTREDDVVSRLRRGDEKAETDGERGGGVSSDEDDEGSRRRVLRARPPSARRCVLPSRVCAASVAWLATRTPHPTPSTITAPGCRTDLPQLLLLSKTDGELYVQVYHRRGSVVSMYGERACLAASGPNVFALHTALAERGRVTRTLLRATHGLNTNPIHNAQLLLREGVDREGWVCFRYGYVVARRVDAAHGGTVLPARRALPSMLDLLRSDETELRTWFLQAMGWLSESSPDVAAALIDGDAVAMPSVARALERRVGVLVLLGHWHTAAMLLARHHTLHPLYPGIALELSAGRGQGWSALRASVEGDARSDACWLALVLAHVEYDESSVQSTSASTGAQGHGGDVGTGVEVSEGGTAHLYELLRRFPWLPLSDQIAMAVALLLPSEPTTAHKENLITALRWIADHYDAHDPVSGVHGRSALLLAVAVHGLADDAAVQAYVDETGEVQLPVCLVSALGLTRSACYRGWVAAYSTWLNANGHYLLRGRHELQLLKTARLRAEVGSGERRAEAGYGATGAGSVPPFALFRAPGLPTCAPGLGNVIDPRVNNTTVGMVGGGGRTVELRCNCGQAMHATAPIRLNAASAGVNAQLARRTRAPCGNPECQQWQAPMCTVCGERMEDKRMELPPERSFVWCTVCLHGGHWCHLKEWFAKHRKCAVENCPCHCCSGCTL